MSIYEWVATAVPYDRPWPGDETAPPVRFKGEVELENHRARHYVQHSELEKKVGLDAVQAASRNGLDPETVEVIDITLIDEGPEEKPWWNPFKID
jgi:hypothetical protein